MVVMKKAVSFILFTALAVSCLSGCGGEFADGTGKPGGAVSGGAVSSGAVSEGVVSGGAVKEEAGEDVQARGRLGLYCSRNCGYFFRGDTPEELVQVFFKDGKKKVYEMPDVYELMYVGEDELIYWHNGKQTMYTVPIVSGTDGTEELKPAEEKRIPGVPDDLKYLGATYADGQYFIYCREGEAEVRCYNRKTGKTSEMPMPGKIKKMVDDEIEEVTRIGGRLYLCTDEGIICWQMEENKVYSCGGSWNLSYEVYTKDGVFGIQTSKDKGVGRNAFFIDPVEQKKTTFISESEVDRLLAQEFGDVRRCSMWELFLDGSRIYVPVNVEWVKDKTCYIQTAVLSREIDGSGELKYERKLTEELVAAERNVARQKVEPLKKAWDGLGTDDIDISGIEKVQYYDGYCLIFDGKAYLVAGIGEKTGACYDLKSGACKEVNKGDWEYYAADILTGEEE